MKLRLFKRPARQLPLWADVAIVAIACLAYVVIALLFIGQESSYFDEGFSSYIARFNPLEIAHYTALDVHPPLYYIALHYWQAIVGIDVFSLRLMSILWGAVALIFVYLLVRRNFGKAAGYSALLFTIMSPLFIRYSEAMRMYTMAIAIIAAATYVLTITVTSQTKHRRKLWAVYALLVTAGMWTNYFTAFIWLAHLAWVAWEYKGKNNKLLVEWAAAVGLAVVLYLPWLPWLLLRFGDVQANGFWIKPISVDTIVSTVTTATAYTSSSLTTNWLAIATCAYSAAIVVVVIKVYKKLSPKRLAVFKLLLLCSIVPIAALIIMSLPPFRSSYVYRYALNGIFIGTIVIGIAFALVQFKQHNLVKKTALYLLAIIVLTSGVIAAKQSGNRSLDTGVKNMVSQAIERVHAHASQGAPIVSRSPYTYYTAALYETPNHPVYYVFSNNLNKVGSTHMLYDHPQQRGIKDLALFASHHNSIWILAEDRHSAATPPAQGWLASNRSFILYDSVTRAPTAYASEYIKP